MILLPHLPPSYNNVVTYEMHKHWLAEATILKFLSFLLVILGLNFKTSQFICGSDSWLPVPVGLTRGQAPAQGPEVGYT